LIEGDAALDIGDETLLRLEQRNRLVPLTLGLEELAQRVDRVLVVRVGVDGPSVVVDGLPRLRQRRLRPEPAELFVDRRQLLAKPRIPGKQPGERLGTPLEQG